MKRREHASCTLYPKSFPWPSWYMRSAGHSSRQRHDGPSISYWRYHPVRADKLARALAALSGAPEGWVWRVGIQKSGPRVSFRVPPTPFREPAYTKGPGHCCVCGQPIFRFGWHRDLWGDGRPNQNMAQLLRRGLELMDCAERSCPAPEGSSEAPLLRNRRTPDQECRGRSPHSPVQGRSAHSKAITVLQKPHTDRDLINALMRCVAAPPSVPPATPYSTT